MFSNVQYPTTVVETLCVFVSFQILRRAHSCVEINDPKVDCRLILLVGCNMNSA